MATAFVIACPECGKQVKVTDALVGKKIRCKQCQAVYPVRAPGRSAAAKPQPARSEKPKQEDAPVLAVAADDDEDDNPNPYGLAVSEEAVPRCPQCAKEMESREAKICVHCGYNLETRTKAETRKVYETTAGDKFLWRLPGILCVITIIIFIVVDVLCWVKMKDWGAGSWMQNEDGTWLIRPHAFTLYITVALSLIGISLGKFAYRRLVVNNQPPEKVIEREKRFDDE